MKQNRYVYLKGHWTFMETMHAYYMTVRKHDASYQQINIYESHQYKILLVCDADYYNDKFICTTIQRIKLFSQS